MSLVSLQNFPKRNYAPKFNHKRILKIFESDILKINKFAILNRLIFLNYIIEEYKQQIIGFMRYGMI